MGRRGPPKKPSEIKRLEGNPGNNKLNDREPDFDQDAHLKPPTDLGKDGAAEWDRVMPMLIQFGVLRKPDIICFHQYCKILDDVRFYEATLAKLRKKGINPLSLRTLNAAQQRLISLRTLLRHYQQELGITPASRSAIKAKFPKGRNAKGGNTQTTTANIPEKGNVTRFFKKSIGN